MSKAHRVSASGRRRLPLCKHWARGDVPLPYGEAKGCADLGSGLHEIAAEEGEGLEALLVEADLERVVAKWKLSDRTRETLVQLRESWRRWWAEFSVGLPWRTEVPYAFDTLTGSARELTLTGAREYGTPPHEIPGTTDAVVLVNGGAVIVDLKTGRPPKRARDHLDQLMHAAVCVRRIHHIDRARLIIAHVMPDDVRPDWIDVDALDIDTAAAEMQGDLDGIAGAEPQPGPHCAKTFCPLLPSCSATTRHLVEGLPMTGPIPNARDLERYLDVLPRIEAWIEERKRACKAMLEEAGGRIDLPSGRMYRFAQEERESPRLDVDGAEEALRSMFGEYVDKAIERKTNWTQIGKAISAMLAAKGDAKRGEASRLNSEARARLRAIGAVKVSRFAVAEIKERGA